jgi:hypothetical protein
MKRSHILLLLSSAGWTFCAEPSSYKLESSSASEVFSTKILKIYQADADTGSYVAYVVDWRGQEIVVIPSSFSLPHAPLKVGDIVRCSMRTSPIIPGSNKRTSLSFAIMTAPDTESLEAFIVAARERREKRDAALKNNSDEVGAVKSKE